jgi:hypothetical protein
MYLWNKWKNETPLSCLFCILSYGEEYFLSWEIITARKFLHLNKTSSITLFRINWNIQQIWLQDIFKFYSILLLWLHCSGIAFQWLCLLSYRNLEVCNLSSWTGGLYNKNYKIEHVLSFKSSIKVNEFEK